jgi:hypothetical protein
MKNLKKQFLVPVAILVMLLATGPQAFSQFTLSGEFRPREEYSHGYKTLAAEDQHASFFISQRTRLNLMYAGEKLKTGLVLQDVRA